MNNFDIKEWRTRLNITQESAASLLGVHLDAYISWEKNIEPVCKTTKLALLACELAYIAADQYVEQNPSKLHNNSFNKQSEALGRQRLIDSFLENQTNAMPNELLITLRPQSLIYRIKQC